jgi:hypothetical protein
MCACVRTCKYVGAWECASAYVDVALLFQHATRMRHIVMSFVVPQPAPDFSTLSHQRCDFRGKKLLSMKCVLIFCTNFV